MNWQQIVSLAIVAFTAVLLIRSGIRKQKRAWSGGCSGSCDCTPVAHKANPLESPPAKQYLS